MRPGWKSLIAVALAVAVAPLSATADENVEAQLKLMQERLMMLEDKLDATTDQLDVATQEVEQQRQIMNDAGIADRAGASGVDSFLESLEIGGWLSIGYWHNFNDPSNGCRGTPGTCVTAAALNANTGGAHNIPAAGIGSGVLGFANTTNPDAQGFSFDQLWFELERPVSPEQRSGFRADITFGKIAGILSGGGAFTGRGAGRGARSDSDVYIHQANIQYLADTPIGDVKFTVGKFSTLIGYEVAQTTYNHNLSRGLLWSVFQPIDHLGLLLSGTVDRRISILGHEGVVDWDIGVVNGFHTDDPDVNHSKTFTGRTRFTAENWSLAAALIYGPEDGLSEDDYRNLQPVIGATAGDVGIGGSEKEEVGVFDLIATWDPFTDLTTWFEFNRVWINYPHSTNPDAWGISTGGRYEVNERMGATMRFEFGRIEDNTGVFGCFLNFGTCGLPGDAEAFSITSTVDYALTDRIKLRGEIRWDDVEVFGRRQGGVAAPAGTNPATDSVFNEGSGDTGDSDQFLAGAEIVYEF